MGRDVIDSSSSKGFWIYTCLVSCNHAYSFPVVLDFRLQSEIIWLFKPEEELPIGDGSKRMQYVPLECRPSQAYR